jgi:ribose transport system substrate-binding protein
MRYAVGSASNERREEGFLEAISEYPDIEVLSSDQRAGVTSESAQNKADSLLQRFPELDGAFCPNEPTTFGMLRALEEAGRAGKVKLVGFDTSDKLIQAMRDDKVHGLILQDPFNMGYLAVKTCVAYRRGRQVDTRIDTGSIVATRENMDKPRIQALLSPPIE